MRDPNTANYYALLIAILCNESAREALKDMYPHLSSVDRANFFLPSHGCVRDVSPQVPLYRQSEHIHDIIIHRRFLHLHRYYDEYDNVITAKALAAIDFVLLEEN